MGDARKHNIQFFEHNPADPIQLARSVNHNNKKRPQSMPFDRESLTKDG